MKKKIKLVIIIAIGVLGFVNLSFISIKNNKISSHELANIEALVSTLEAGRIRCWHTISSELPGKLTHVTWCGDCTAHLARNWDHESPFGCKPPTK